MLRKFGLIAVAALLLAACGDEGDENIVNMEMPRASRAPQEMPGLMSPVFSPSAVLMANDAPNALFSLSHQLSVTMAHDAVISRFKAAQNACLKDKALQCVLTSASMSEGRQVSAQLQVALPHDKVAIFEKRLMNPVAGDGGTNPEITARSTSTENETQRAADTERQLAQATSYRDKLEELSKRPGLSVDEVLKLHEALSLAQSAVETATAAKRASETDIRLDKVNISLEEKIIPVAAKPFDKFWSNSGAVFMDSLEKLIYRIIHVLPWLPIVFVLAWMLRRILNRMQIRRTAPRN